MTGFARARNTVFIAVGLAVLLLSIILNRTDHPDVHELLLALGVVVISVSLLELLFMLGGGNPIEAKIRDLSDQVQRLSRAVKLIEQADRIGLSDMHDCTGNYGGKDEWLALMKGAHVSMDLMGRSLYEWIRAPELDRLIIDKIINEGVRFRWLLMNISNRHLDQLEEDGQQIGESIIRKIVPVCDRLERIRASLPESKRQYLELRTFTNIPLYCSLLRIDDKYLITPYLQSVASRNSPLFVINGRSGPWAIAYDREFETLWISSQPYAGRPLADPALVSGSPDGIA